jgi:hypothetical protein
MARYKIWDRQETIYTPAVGSDGKGVFTPEEWIEMWPWARNPNAKMIIGGGTINGALCEPFEEYVNMFARMGVQFTDGMTDQEKLDAIEYFQDNPPPQPPSAEERQAAALEALAMEGLDDAE